MKADFSRDTFNPAKHFSRVLMQQGRVQLDADWNEQIAILLHYLHTLATDVIGPYGGPEGSPGFALVNPDTLDEAERKRLGGIKPGDVVLSAGRYYIEGLLVESDQRVRVTIQPEENESGRDRSAIYLLYLEAYERHVSALEDTEILEVALGGLDTATRAQIVWQTGLLNAPVGDVRLPPDPDGGRDQALQYWEAWHSQQAGRNRGTLRAQSADPSKETSLCITPPESRYRGAENQLYRVEIHTEGASFKWSRDNGSVAFAISAAQNQRITLAALGRDAERSLEIGSLVEVSDDSAARRGAADPLLSITDVEPIEQVVTLSAAPASGVGSDPTRHPLLRRWDGQGPIAVGEWITLEDGVQIQFQPGEYRTGDYWLIPARTATGDVEWPSETVAGQRQPAPQPPHGITRWYAPIGLVAVDRDGKVGKTLDLRSIFAPLTKQP